MTSPLPARDTPDPAAARAEPPITLAGRLTITGLAGLLVIVTAGHWLKAEPAPILAMTTLAMAGWLAAAGWYLSRRVSGRERTASQVQTTLTHHEQLLTSLLHTVPGGMLLCLRSGQILAANDGARRLLGLDGGALPELGSVIQPAQRPTLQQALQAATFQSSERLEVLAGPVAALPHRLALRASLHTDDPAGQVLILIDDLADTRPPKPGRPEAQWRYDILSALLSSQAQVPQPDLFLMNACRLLVETGGFALAWVVRGDGDTGLTTTVCRWGRDDGFLAAPGGVPRSAGIEAQALRRHETLVCNVLSPEPAGGWQQVAMSYGFQAAVLVPLPRPVGIADALIVLADVADSFDATALRLLDDLVRLYALAAGCGPVASPPGADERLIQILSTLGEAVIHLDGGGNVVWRNAHAQSLFGPDNASIGAFGGWSMMPAAVHGAGQVVIRAGEVALRDGTPLAGLGLPWRTTASGQDGVLMVVHPDHAYDRQGIVSPAHLLSDQIGIAIGRTVIRHLRQTTTRLAAIMAAGKEASVPLMTQIRQLDRLASLLVEDHDQWIRSHTQPESPLHCAVLFRRLLAGAPTQIVSRVTLDLAPDLPFLAAGAGACGHIVINSLRLFDTLSDPLTSIRIGAVAVRLGPVDVPGLTAGDYIRLTFTETPGTPSATRTPAALPWLQALVSDACSHEGGGAQFALQADPPHIVIHWPAVSGTITPLAGPLAADQPGGVRP